MAEAPDLVGMRVDRRYDVTEKLFSGFYGTCWKAYDEHTKDIVCIKTFFVENKDQIKELTILKEFVDGHFEHDNLCRVLNVSLKKASVMSGQSNTAPKFLLQVKIVVSTELFYRYYSS